MAAVDVFSWNPRRSPVPGRLGARLPIGRRVNNFGDLLGPLVVSEMCARAGLDARRGPRRVQLLSIGSVLHFAESGSVVWGTGRNGKVPASLHRTWHLDVRAVRGPRTREFLTGEGVRVPEVFGDPGLLLGQFYTREQLGSGRPPRPLTVVPNLNDMGSGTGPHQGPAGRAFQDALLAPTQPLWDCLGTIAASDLVVGSSLHGIVVAESLGIPARLVTSPHEPSFKYDDYYRGSGRSRWAAAATVEEAVEMGGETPPVWDPEALMAAFPADLFLPDRAALDR